MSKCRFALLALAISLFGTQCWASTCSPVSEGPVSCTNTFSPTDTTGTFDFSGSGDGKITVSFVTVLTTFTLTATVNHTIDPFDPNEFPAGTVAVTYCNGNQDQYDFTGNAGGPNGVPVKGTDYKGLITLELTYSTCQTVHNPAFAHAPGDSTTFTEDILTSYYEPVVIPDPTMDGSTPGLSSVAAADEPLADNGNDTFCSLTLTQTNNPSGNKPEEEVTLKIVSGSDCNAKGIRDKTARLSVVATDSFGNFSNFVALKNVEANKFHWDNKNGLNEFDISTDGLVSGQTYTVTVFSSKISPQSTTFVAP